MTKLHKFFTVWTLIVSYSIFILCILFNKKIPLWLLLFGTCLLTSTSIIGTFFHTIMHMNHKSLKKGQSKKIILLKDTIWHLGPLIIFILFFPILVKRTRPLNIKLNNEKNYSNYFLMTLIPFISMACIYLIFNNPDFIYEDDSIGIVSKNIISFAIFCASYQIYFNWSKVILKF